ncbi:RNA 2',3'-cyclic phosphodiesterase [Sphingobium aquiterrae]|uniref:RNA 2',3'-cyclic phosphodiesterase n=1 Tax=Sphingobium aquiterrae TaxID=2038656 RepID=UPI003017AE73
MHRLFVAIRPPAAIRVQLLGLMQGVEGARWQGDDQLHLTLRFIGEVDRHRAADIADALARITSPMFTLALHGVGSFDQRGRVNALWAGVQPHDEVGRLHRSVDRACVNAGVAPDMRAYLPHITLARANRGTGPLDDFVAAHGGLSSPPFAVREFGLYESILGSEGAVYHLAERYRLTER